MPCFQLNDFVVAGCTIGSCTTFPVTWKRRDCTGRSRKSVHHSLVAALARLQAIGQAISCNNMPMLLFVLFVLSLLLLFFLFFLALTQILGKIQKGSKGTTRAGVGSTRGLKEIINTQGKAQARPCPLCELKKIDSAIAILVQQVPGFLG